MGKCFMERAISKIFRLLVGFRFANIRQFNITTKSKSKHWCQEHYIWLLTMYSFMSQYHVIIPITYCEDKNTTKCWFFIKSKWNTKKLEKGHSLMAHRLQFAHPWYTYNLVCFIQKSHLFKQMIPAEPIMFYSL